MTKEQAKEYIPLLRAYAEGKTIQYYDEGKWEDRASLKFSEPQGRYRIKPEQITMAVWFCPGSDLITEMDMSKHAPDWRKATAVVTFD